MVGGDITYNTHVLYTYTYILYTQRQGHYILYIYTIHMNNIFIEYDTYWWEGTKLCVCLCDTETKLCYVCLCDTYWREGTKLCMCVCVIHTDTYGGKGQSCVCVSV